jgi:hypothetical protein
MVEDVMLSVGERSPIYFYGVPGGVIPTPADVYGVFEIHPGRRRQGGPEG